jgi:hypothetical protein
MTLRQEFENEISGYYTPVAEELHIGFECELLYQSDNKLVRTENYKWHPVSLDKNNLQKAHSLIKNKKIRVKSIDKEDCISLGLELKVWDNGSGYFQKDNYTIGIHGFDSFCTVSQNDYGNNIIRFSGDLKNKSELKRILQQTECI